MGLYDRDYMRHSTGGDYDVGENPPPRRRIWIAVIAVLMILLLLMFL